MKNPITVNNYSIKLQRYTNHVFIRILLPFSLCLFMLSCSSNTGSDPDPSPPSNGNGDGQAVSFSEDIAPILQTSCAVSGCHDSGTQESGVDLSSYQSALNSEGTQYQQQVISPGSPDESPLVDKIEPSPEIGARMPYQRDPLSQTDIDSIRAWIEDGAPDN